MQINAVIAEKWKSDKKNFVKHFARHLYNTIIYHGIWGI